VKRLSVLLLMMVFPLSLQAQTFKAGQHYMEFPFPQPVEGNKIEVREFFWYGCPHCYALEPAIHRWLKRKPANVNYVRTPGVAPHWLLDAQAYYTFEALGVVDKMHPAMFDAMNKNKQRFKTEEALAAFVAKHGVDPKAFRDAFGSFGVRIGVEKAKQLSQAYTINSVPTLVVDGRYLTSPAMAGGEDVTMQVVDFLIKKASAERKGKSAR